ncbi:MAG: T9SS type A sorting domain-containing protein [Chitinophagales bacterium]
MKKLVLLSAFAVCTILVFTNETTDINGKAGRTGSPGEQTCVNGCHSSFALNSGPGSVAITSNIPVDGYRADSTYTMNVTITQSGFSLFGLGFEALLSTNANGGTLTAGTGTHTSSSGGKTNITHNSGGGAGTSGSHTFTFKWKAPATGKGDVTFYCSGMAANGNNSNSGDYVYTTSQTVSEYVAGPNGIANIIEKASVNVYPNPVSEKLNVQFTLKEAANVSLKLHSLNGALIKEAAIEAVSGNNHTTFDLNDVQAGNYVLQIVSANGTICKNVVVK